jgi:hypothetical protein
VVGFNFATISPDQNLFIFIRKISSVIDKFENKWKAKYSHAQISHIQFYMNLISVLRHTREKSLLFIIGQTGGKTEIRDTALSDLPHRIKKHLGNVIKSRPTRCNK